MNFLEILTKYAKAKINEIEFVEKHKTKRSYFSRNTGKMKFYEAIYFILKGIKKSLQIELDEWFSSMDKESMTKQSFSELRQKISPKAFIELNDMFMEKFYDEVKFKTHKGYRLLAIDGSITEVPNSKKTRKYFGTYHNQSEYGIARAMVSVIYDIENDFLIETDITSWQSSEREVAKKLIKKLETKGFKNDLILFDRGYPSVDIFNFLEEKKLKFLMRVKANKCQKQIDLANKKDQIIKLDKLQTSLRVINIVLDTGEIEKLVTNLGEEFIYEEFKELYFKRWGIEIKYNQLKSKYDLENFSGSLPICIEQDFYANIYLVNLLTLAKNEANEQVQEEKKNLKYDYKINMNIFVGKMIPTLISILLEENPQKRSDSYQNVINQIKRNVVAIRPNRTFKRKEPSRKCKFPQNRRPSR